jgi:hypothetical protein
MGMVMTVIFNGVRGDNPATLLEFEGTSKQAPKMQHCPQEKGHFIGLSILTK